MSDQNITEQPDRAARGCASVNGSANRWPVYIFHRKDGWYPLELPSDSGACENAECNPGTVRVVNAVTGKQVWPNDKLTDGGTP